MEPNLLFAAGREAGVRCPHCGIAIATGEAIAQCRTCGTCHHQYCWQARGGCGAYSCAPARREFATPAPTTSGGEVAGGAPAVMPWRITTEDLGGAVLLPTRAPAMAGSYGQPPPPIRPPSSRTSGLAIAALVCAIAGIPLFGLITGLVAVVLGAMALGDTTKKRRKGTAMAVTGLVLGLVDAAGWSVLLIHLLNGGSLFPGSGRHGGPNLANFRVDPKQIDALPATVARAMRANVLLTGRVTLGEVIGSGVILRITGGEAQILTNRHVVDPGFENSDAPRDPASLKPLEVSLIDQSRTQGQVVWIAPDGVDLAIISAPVGSAARATAWPATRPSIIGDGVFAIGNPQNLGWSQSQGYVSQFRSAKFGDHEVSVIQSSAPINPGNSGGGLYDRDGYLIGINTWTYDKRVSEGLGFSIALKSFMELSPTEYQPLPGLRNPLELLKAPPSKKQEQESKQP